MFFIFGLAVVFSSGVFRAGFELGGACLFRAFYFYGRFGVWEICFCLDLFFFRSLFRGVRVIGAGTIRGFVLRRIFFGRSTFFEKVVYLVV